MNLYPPFFCQNYTQTIFFSSALTIVFRGVCQNGLPRKASAAVRDADEADPEGDQADDDAEDNVASRRQEFAPAQQVESFKAEG